MGKIPIYGTFGMNNIELCLYVMYVTMITIDVYFSAVTDVMSQYTSIGKICLTGYCISLCGHRAESFISIAASVSMA